MTAPVTIGDVLDALEQSVRHRAWARHAGNDIQSNLARDVLAKSDAEAESTLNTYIDQRLAGRTGETK
jgi:hypothetical protein